ncbi:MAG: hypothetical protein H7039_14730, partial [Bryobacteraceae bacterium]|nr:hypothetical protein [Bryobacteraceae bacterium]
EAATVNGEVLVSTSGTAHVHTVNGSIEAWLLRPFWEKAPEFTAVNGRISIRVPENAGYRLRAETRNGKVVSALRGFRGKATEQSMDGQIGVGGSGSPMIIRTLNGAIELRQKR